MRIRFFDILWDTDNKTARLPTEFIIDGIAEDEDINENGSEYLSEESGCLVESFDWEQILPNFTCLGCGGHRLEEIITNATVSTEIVSVWPGGDVQYGNLSVDNGEVNRYQCLTCGKTIPPTDSEELAEYLAVKKDSDGVN